MSKYLFKIPVTEDFYEANKRNMVQIGEDEACVLSMAALDHIVQIMDFSIPKAREAVIAEIKKLAITEHYKLANIYRETGLPVALPDPTPVEPETPVTEPETPVENTGESVI